MKNIVLMLSLTIVTTLKAEIITIHHLDSIDKRLLLFSHSGEVFDIYDNQTKLQAKSAFKQSRKIEILIEKNERISKAPDLRNTIIEIKQREKLHGRVQTIQTKDNSTYNPNELLNSYITNLKTSDETRKFFYSMDKNLRGRSQCYNRAHVWSWELNKKFYNNKEIQTGKMWIFFTTKYIKEYNYKWWFHVAPYINEKGSPIVLDRTFMREPADLKTWTDKFIKSQAPCIEVNRYSDYRDHQKIEDCYIIKTSLFYWQPFQIQNLEAKNEQRKSWQEHELKKAYRNTKGWFAKVPHL